MFFREPGQTQVRSLPAAWTDVVEPDPFLVVSAGRAYFRATDLLQLRALLSELTRRCKRDYAVDVKGFCRGGGRVCAADRLQLHKSTRTGSSGSRA